ncbi:MAG: heavy-metal-associated domain-containing protein [Eubacterium ramulus]
MDCGCCEHDHDHEEHEHHHEHEEHEHHHHHHHDDDHCDCDCDCCDDDDDDCDCGCHDHDHHHHHEEVHHVERVAVPGNSKIYILQNLGCAHCAAKMEEKINNLPGVTAATITYTTKQLRL